MTSITTMPFLAPSASLHVAATLRSSRVVKVLMATGWFALLATATLVCVALPILCVRKRG